MSGTCCDHEVTFDGLSADYRRRLWLVIGINAAMFAVEMAGGHLAESQALKADALDFLADTLTYGASLAVIGQGLRLRSGVALAKATSLAAMGLWVLGSTLWAFFVTGVPMAPLMGGIAVMALVANLASVLLLVRYKDGDANVRSVWLCSRNDAVGNVAVIAAAGLVWLSGTRWPDLIVALVMAGLFLNSARQIFAQALAEWRQNPAIGAAAPVCAPDHAQAHSHSH